MMRIVLLGILIALLATASAIKGEIRSCSGWRLNGLPEVRRFIKDDPENHANLYDDLKVNFISGHVPELFILDDEGNEIEKIDLAKYSTQELHDLLVGKGFKKGEPKVKVEVMMGGGEDDDDDDDAGPVVNKDDVDDADL